MEALQAAIPELKNTMEDRFTEMIQYFEGSQTRIREEQNLKLEECVKGQDDLKSAITLLMTEVRTLSGKVSRRSDDNSPRLNSDSRDRSVVEQLRRSEILDQEGSGERRQYDSRNTEGNNSRVHRLEFPVFYGEDPDGWISKVERYFDVYGLTKPEKMGAAVMGLEDDALH